MSSSCVIALRWMPKIIFNNVRTILQVIARWWQATSHASGKVDTNLCHQIASLSHIELMYLYQISHGSHVSVGCNLCVSLFEWAVLYAISWLTMLIWSFPVRFWCYDPWLQGSWGQHGAHLGPTGPRWVPCWPHGELISTTCYSS